MNNYNEEEQKRIFSDNLRFYLNLRGFTQAELAQKLGLRQSTVAEWFYGRKYPRPKNMQLIADILGVYLTDLRDPRNKKKNVIPVLGYVRAGIPIDAIEEILDYEEISEDMARQGEHFALRIKGDSMEPRMKEGDIVIIRRQKTVDNGDIAVILINGNDATIKRFYKSATGISLISFNSNYEPFTFSSQEVNELPVCVIGKVVELRAKF